MRAQPRDQRGETLLEILVSVSIMGVCFVAVIAGIGTTLLATDTHRQEATAEAVLRTYAERMQDPADVAYVACATTATYTTPVGFTLPTAGWSASVTLVQSWQGDTPPTFSATCPSPDKGVQQLTLRVQSPVGNHRATETVVIVKRKP